MRFRCPNPDCRSTLKAKPEQIGKRFRCPKCEMLVTVPVVGELESGAGESRSLIDAESRAGESLLGVDSESDTGGSRSAVDTVAGDAGSTRDSAATSTDAEDAVAEVWKPGDVILELYEVKDVLGEGGFGTVFKVHHRGWNTDLAVKSPRAGLFQSKRQKKRFVDECQTWIDLGIHPNAVSCFYVRTLGGIPRVFAELVDGKDLKHWIAQKKIRNVKTVLDIAIQNRVSSVVFSPDGCCALSGSSDNTLRVWEVSTGRCLRTFEGHTDWVLSVVFSPDGRCALSASGDKTVRLWELSTGRCLRTFEGHTGKISSVAVSPDSRRALSASGDKTVRLWELSTGRCLKTFKRSDFEVHSVAFSADGRCALLGSYKTLSLRDLSTGRCLRTFKGHVRDVILVVISPDGRWALSGSDDKTLRLWELATGRCLRTFEGHTTSVNSVAFSPDGQCALSGSGATVNSDDNTLRLWELLKAPPRGSCAIAVPQDAAELGKKAQEADKAIEKGRAHIAEGRYRAAIAVISEARRIRGYERRRELLQLHHQLSIACVRRSLQAGWCTQTCEVGWNSARSVAFIPDGRRALLASYETLHLFELSTGRCLRTFKGHEKPVNSVALSSDGCWALTGSEDKTLCLWELSAGRCLRTFKGHTERVYSVALGSDGRWAVSGGGDSTLRLWELSTGRCLRTFEGHADSVNSVAFSPDGRWALSGSYDKTLRLWELSTGRCLRTFEGHADSVSSVAFSPDGHWALSGSYDKTLRLWKLSTGRCARTFEGHADSVSSVAFSPDGRWALSGSDDKALRFWKLSTGRCARTFERHSDRVKSVAFSPDGRWALSASWDRTLRLWELDWEYEFPGHADWDDGARPYLETFLTLRTPPDGQLPQDRQPTEEEVAAALSRGGQPKWNDKHFISLINQLRRAGYGWLRPEGVKKTLEEMTAEWKGPSPLPGK